MLLFGKRAGALKELFSGYVSDLRDCVKWFESFFSAYAKGCSEQELEDIAGKVREAEAHCDTKRREIQKQLTKGTFMPEFRSDIFALIDLVDRVPNQMEEIVIYVSIAYTPIPEVIAGLFWEVVQRNITCVRNLAEALDLLLTDLNASTERAKEVEVEETEIDTIERELYRGIFHDKDYRTTPGQKLLLKEFVRGVCAVSNRAEDASDRIALIALKRRA